MSAALLADAVQATDALQSARPRRQLSVVAAPSKRIPPAAGDTVRDRDSVQRLRRGIFRAMPPEPSVKPELALQEMLRSEDVYGTERSLTVAPYDEAYFMLSKRPLVPQPVAQLCSPEARAKISAPETWIVRPDEEQLEVADSGIELKPYWDPLLKSSRKLRMSFFRVLHNSRLLGFRRGIRCRIGCFFVWKKDKLHRRLVIDARAVNQLHRRPPRSNLAVPAMLSQLSLAPESLDFADLLESYAAADAELPADVNDDTPTELLPQPDGPLDPDSPCGCSIDLCDGFYQFLAPEVASFFGLGETLTAREWCTALGIDSVPVFDDDSGVWEYLCDDTKLEGVFTGLAMGWSWALYFCHDALSHAINVAMRSLKLAPQQVGNRSRPVHLSRRVAAAAPYVDNANVIGANAASALKLHRAIVDELRRRGFELHDEHVCEPAFEFLGMVLDGLRRLLVHSRRRSWRLFWSLDDLAHRRGMTGDGIRIVNGHLLHTFGLRPELIATMESLFWFASRHGAAWGPFTADVRAEIITCRGLVFQSYAILDRPVSRGVMCSDSSMHGYQLSWTPALASEVLDACRWRERWRFIELDDAVTNRVEGSSRPQLADRCDIATDDSAFVRWAADADRLSTLPVLGRRPTAPAVPRPHRRPRAVALHNGAVPALPQTLTWPSRYCPIVTGAWRGAQTIHCLESRVALMGLRAAARDHAQREKIVLSLGENLSEILASDKGRSHDPVLKSLLRRAAGLCVVSGIGWRRPHIETGRNPTDAGSRLADSGLLQPGESSSAVAPRNPPTQPGRGVARLGLVA